MKERDIVLSSFQQSDGMIKNRPALVLREMPPFGDLLVCGISTQLHQEVRGFDEIISATDSDFSSSGLAATSLIRLGFLSLLAQKEIKGVIGSISLSRHEQLLKNLSAHLLKNVKTTS